MDLGLKDQTVLVTGSTAGIGFAAATLFAREGASVVVNGRTPERASSGGRRSCARGRRRARRGRRRRPVDRRGRRGA